MNFGGILRLEVFAEGLVDLPVAVEEVTFLMRL